MFQETDADTSSAPWPHMKNVTLLGGKPHKLRHYKCENVGSEHLSPGKRCTYICNLQIWVWVATCRFGILSGLDRVQHQRALWTKLLRWTI